MLKEDNMEKPIFRYETLGNRCKQCGKYSPLDHDGFCFWCWEEIQEGLHMLGDS